MPTARKSVCYCTNLRQSANAISDFYDARLREAGLTAPQYRLLINLKRLGGANITHWAEAVGLDRSTMVRNIRPLEARGLLAQTAGHGKVFTLSPKGEAALEAAAPLWDAAQRKVEALLGEEDAQAILRIADKLQSLKAHAL